MALTKSELRVTCPTCGEPAIYAPGNRWRPFCSERCRGHDLGAWASERFRIASARSGDDSDAAAAGEDPTS